MNVIYKNLFDLSTLTYHNKIKALNYTPVGIYYAFYCQLKQFYNHLEERLLNLLLNDFFQWLLFVFLMWEEKS